jgi:hypothetical protein
MQSLTTNTLKSLIITVLMIALLCACTSTTSLTEVPLTCRIRVTVQPAAQASFLQTNTDPVTVAFNAQAYLPPCIPAEGGMMLANIYVLYTYSGDTSYYTLMTPAEYFNMEGQSAPNYYRVYSTIYWRLYD